MQSTDYIWTRECPDAVTGAVQQVFCISSWNTRHVRADLEKLGGTARNVDFNSFRDKGDRAGPDAREESAGRWEFLTLELARQAFELLQRLGSLPDQLNRCIVCQEEKENRHFRKGKRQNGRDNVCMTCSQSRQTAPADTKATGSAVDIDGGNGATLALTDDVQKLQGDVALQQRFLETLSVQIDKTEKRLEGLKETYAHYAGMLDGTKKELSEAIRQAKVLGAKEAASVKEVC